MEFNQQERRMVERLRKQERQWRWARWTTLLVGVFNVGVCVFISFLVLPHVQSEKDMASAALMLAITFPGILIFAGSATVCLALAVRDWHGNTTRMLLLRLVDESAKRSAKDEHAA